MSKKAPQRVKGLAAKAHKNKPVNTTLRVETKLTLKPAVKASPKPDPRFTQAVQNFEAGMKALQSQKFDRAKVLLEKALEGPSRELADRARMYLNVCNQQLARTSTNFKTAEEHYDYAIALMNRGDLEGARSHMEKITRTTPKADYAYYGLALLECLSGKVEESLRHLEQAVKLNPSLRYQARNDSDFNAMADDPRFTELIYPEPNEMSTAESLNSIKKR